MKDDYRVLHPKRLPIRWPVTQTIVTLIAIKVFEIGEPWTYVAAAILAAIWITVFSLKIVQRKVDPFDITT